MKGLSAREVLEAPIKNALEACQQRIHDKRAALDALLQAGHPRADKVAAELNALLRDHRQWEVNLVAVQHGEVQS